MVVAHPDDETLVSYAGFGEQSVYFLLKPPRSHYTRLHAIRYLYTQWGGEYLLSEGSHVHVVTTSTINKETSTRREEFTNVENRLGFEGEFLDGTDSHTTQKIEDRIQHHVQDLVCSRQWDKVITHGPEGEYGHPQHQQVFDTVLDAVRFCCHSFDNLLVFEPHPTANYSFPEEKKEVANLYNSQRKVIAKFSDWKENIVQLADYNYKTASKDCIAGALTKSKTRKCRLQNMMNLDEISPQQIPAIFADGRLWRQWNWLLKQFSYSTTKLTTIATATKIRLK